MANDQVLGRVVQVSVNPRGGVPKLPVFAAELTTSGVRGDKQRDRRFHGGPERAVSLYALERIEALRAAGHPISPGSTGENLTIQGLDWNSLHPGDRLRIGEWVELQIASYCVPCKNIAGSFSDGEFVRLGQKLNPGWSRLYARVLAEGTVRPGDPVEHLPA